MKRKYCIHFMLISLFFVIFLKYLIVSEKSLIDIGELWQAVFALHIMRYGVLNYLVNIPFLLVIHQGPLAGYLLIPSLYLFGQTNFALRLPRIIIATCTAILIYFFAKDFYDKRTALLSAIAFLIAPIFMVPSQEHTITPFFLILSLYVINKFYITEERKYLYLFSFICGLGILVRLSFLFFLSSLAATHMLIFKGLNKKISPKDIGITFLIFILASYPFIMFNIEGDYCSIDNNFPGVSPRCQKLATLKYALKNFPETNEGENLLDVGKNFKIGLIKNFPEILQGDDIYLTQQPTYFLQIFIFSLVFISILTFYRISKRRFIEVRKDLFLLVNFIIISFLISTVTITSFKKIEFTMLFPVYILIVGRSFSEIIGILKKNNEILFYFVIIFIIYLPIINTYEFFESLISYDSKSERCYCVIVGKDVVDYILKANNSKIFVSDHGSIMNFNWHMYKTGIYDKKFYKFFDLYSPSLEKDSLYVLAGEKCLDNKDSTIEKFLGIVYDYNKKPILENYFYLESGDLGYAIYRVI